MNRHAEKVDLTRAAGEFLLRAAAPGPDLVTSAEVQALAGVSVQTVRLWARQGRLGPKHFLPTCNRGAVAYERSHVLAALADRPPNRNRRREPTPAADPA